MRLKIKCTFTLFYILFLTGSVVAQIPESKGGMDKKRQHITEVAALVGKGSLKELKPILNTSLDEGMSINELKEVMIHAYAYCGFPRALRGLQTFVAVLNERKANDIEDKIGNEASPIVDTRSKYERGRDILAEISGVRPTDTPKADYAILAPEIEIFLKEHLFADLFERDVLSYAEREIATVAILAAIGGVEPMMKGHISIAVNLGVTCDELYHLFNIIEEQIGHSESNVGRMILQEFCPCK